MTEIINLRNVRKRRERDEKADIAEANRVKFGTPRKLREARASEQALKDKKLDQHHLGRSKNGDE